MKHIIGITIFTAGLYFTIVSFPSSIEVNSSFALLDGLQATVALRFFLLLPCWVVPIFCFRTIRRSKTYSFIIFPGIFTPSCHVGLQLRILIFE